MDDQPLGAAALEPLQGFFYRDDLGIKSHLLAGEGLGAMSDDRALAPVILSDYPP
jgi:hypothetical protein